MGNYTNSQENFQRRKRISSQIAGEYFEKESSQAFHQKGVPILVDSDLFKKRGLGQVDLAIKQKGQIIVAECKSHSLPLCAKQYYRLRCSLSLICQVFALKGKILVLRPFAKSHGTA